MPQSTDSVDALTPQLQPSKSDLKLVESPVVALNSTPATPQNETSGSTILPANNYNANTATPLKRSPNGSKNSSPQIPTTDRPITTSEQQQQHMIHAIEQLVKKVTSRDTSPEGEESITLQPSNSTSSEESEDAKLTVIQSTARISHSGYLVPYTTVTESDNRSVYLRNVAFHATKQDLIHHFESCGEIVRVTIPLDGPHSLPKGRAYIEFATLEAVEKALKLNESLFLGRSLIVLHKYTTPRDPNVPQPLQLTPQQQEALKSSLSEPTAILTFPLTLPAAAIQQLAEKTYDTIPARPSNGNSNTNNSHVIAPNNMNIPSSYPQNSHLHHPMNAPPHHHNHHNHHNHPHPCYSQPQHPAHAQTLQQPRRLQNRSTREQPADQKDISNTTESQNKSSSDDQTSAGLNSDVEKPKTSQDGIIKASNEKKSNRRNQRDVHGHSDNFPPMHPQHYSPNQQPHSPMMKVHGYMAPVWGYFPPGHYPDQHYPPHTRAPYPNDPQASIPPTNALLASVNFKNIRDAPAFIPLPKQQSKIPSVNHTASDIKGKLVQNHAQNDGETITSADGESVKDKSQNGDSGISFPPYPHYHNDNQQLYHPSHHSQMPSNIPNHSYNQQMPGQYEHSPHPNGYRLPHHQPYMYAPYHHQEIGYYPSNNRRNTNPNKNNKSNKKQNTEDKSTHYPYSGSTDESPVTDVGPKKVLNQATPIHD